jgi:hypothetical protein
VILNSFLHKGRRFTRPFLLCPVLLSLIGSPALADEYGDMLDSLGRSRIAINVASAPPRDFNNQTGSFRRQQIGASFIAPFAGSRAAGSSLWSLHASLHQANAEISFFPKGVQLISGKIGISDNIFSDGDDYLLLATIGFASSDAVIDRAQWRFSGTGLGTHVVDRQLALHYGLLYSYSLGRGFLLPVAGVRWNPAPRWLVRAILPASLHARYLADSEWSFGAGVELDGDRYQFFNDGDYPAAPDHAYIRMTQIDCGLDANYRISSIFTVTGELGTALARRLWISSGSGDYFSSRIKTGGYLRARVLCTL